LTSLPESKGAVLIEAAGICKGFSQPDGSRLMVLDQLDLRVMQGELLAVTGASGSGKSTLLHILGGLDPADAGQVFFGGRDLWALSGSELNHYRNRRVGFVYQFHHLLPELLVWENVAFPFLIQRFKISAARERALALLERVGLAVKAQNLPGDLSGGERQRVAIARSLVNAPQLLLADEPTGNLDLATGRGVFSLFRDLVHQDGLTAVMVTHNLELAHAADRHLHLDDGRLVMGGDHP
jgi:lipoprotein-releasing system ATP-binding protein